MPLVGWATGENSGGTWCRRRLGGTDRWCLALDAEVLPGRACSRVLVRIPEATLGLDILEERADAVLAVAHDVLAQHGVRILAGRIDRPPEPLAVNCEPGEIGHHTQHTRRFHCGRTPPDEPARFRRYDRAE